MTTTISFKTNLKVKRQAQKLAKEFGLSLGDILNTLLSDFVFQKEFDSRDEYITNPKFLKKLEKTRKEIERGEVSPDFTTAQEVAEWLDSQDK